MTSLKLNAPETKNSTWRKREWVKVAMRVRGGGETPEVSKALCHMIPYIFSNKKYRTFHKIKGPCFSAYRVNQCCGSGFSESDPDPALQVNPDPDPEF
jgi:hypothetical protein